MAKAAPGSLDDVLAGINKDFGPGSVMLMGEDSGLEVESFSTGILPLDLALGIGGLPRGRIVEIVGTESGGKSTTALHCVAEVQKLGGKCVYVDTEHAMDPVYAKAIGVDVDHLFISQPDNGENALSIVERFTSSGEIDLIVVDSVAALTPRAEIEGEMGDAHIGLLARLMSQALRKLTGIASKTGTCIIFINQIREKVGVVGYGSNETQPGGRALKFYSSVRLDVRRIETLKDSGGDAMANRTRIRVIKNKVAPPFKQAEFDIVYGRGAPKANALLDIAVETGIVKKSGAWFNYEGEQIGQGRVKSALYLEENEATYKAILEDVHTALEAA